MLEALYPRYWLLMSVIATLTTALLTCMQTTVDLCQTYTQLCTAAVSRHSYSHTCTLHLTRSSHAKPTNVILPFSHTRCQLIRTGCLPLQTCMPTITARFSLFCNDAADHYARNKWSTHGNHIHVIAKLSLFLDFQTTYAVLSALFREALVVAIIKLILILLKSRS